MIKLIATDLDGTLLNHDCHVSYDNMIAMQELRNQGVQIAVLTGRTMYEIPVELRKIRGVSYFVFSNGAGISNEEGRLFYAPFPKETAVKVYDLLNEYDTLVELYLDGVPVIDAEQYKSEVFEYYHIDAEFLPEMTRSRMPVEFPKRMLEQENCNLEMFDVFFHNPEERDECRARILESCPGLNITSSLSTNLEIMREGINKASGFRELCRVSGLNGDEVLVLGDSMNDYEVFNIAPNSCAVSNGIEELKQVAKKVICSNEEHVLKYLLEHPEVWKT